MLRFPRLALALALLFPATLPAQSVPFPGGGGYIAGDVLIPIDWEGKPAFLVLLDGASAQREFLHFDWNSQAPFRFRAVAGYFQDSRPCAPGTPVVIRTIGTGADEYVRHDFGDLGKDGTLFSLARGAQPFGAVPNGPSGMGYRVETCIRTSMCVFSQNSRPGAPCGLNWPSVLSALVLTLE